MPEGLPPHLDETQIPTVYYHNWLYSVVPVSERRDDWTNEGLIINYPLIAVLTGYCRNCGRAFSRKIGVDTVEGHYSETIMNVPKEGCVGTDG